MCGIVAILGFQEQIENVLIGSLKKLEYRGYDSAGIAYIDQERNINVVKAVGEIKNLANKISQNFTKGTTGIGHTRWATHGKVTIQNAHPQTSGSVSIVHNGIIENFETIKQMLIDVGETFQSETDSEVIAKLIDLNLKNGMSFLDAFKKTIKSLTGAYAIAAICSDFPETLLGAKNGSPLVVGLCESGTNIYISSDAIALSSIAEKILYLEDGDIIASQKTSEITYQIFDAKDSQVSRTILPNMTSEQDTSKNGFESFMLKEICEEPAVVFNIFNNMFSNASKNIDIQKYKSVMFIACGTSYYAGCLAKYWLEDLARIHVDVEIASEFRYRNPVLENDTLYVFISQSGETIDTLCALKSIQAKKLDTLAIVNVATSSIAREAHSFLEIMAGVEIGVASTKAFAAQIASILSLVLKKSAIDVHALKGAMSSVIDAQDAFQAAAKKIKHCKTMLYLGRGPSYPVALEGALKMKELSYISAQAFPSGEIKHGPIALIDQETYSVIIAPKDSFFEKTISNAQEILARSGPIIVISTTDAKEQLQYIANNSDVFCVFLPTIEPFLSPFLTTIAVHLLAYHTTKLKGLDVDKPRNLAKSVTVE